MSQVSKKGGGGPEVKKMEGDFKWINSRRSSGNGRFGMLKRSTMPIACPSLCFANELIGWDTEALSNGGEVVTLVLQRFNGEWQHLRSSRVVRLVIKRQYVAGVLFSELRVCCLALLGGRACGVTRIEIPDD